VDELGRKILRAGRRCLARLRANLNPSSDFRVVKHDRGRLAFEQRDDTRVGRSRQPKTRTRVLAPRCEMPAAKPMQEHSAKQAGEASTEAFQRYPVRQRWRLICRTGLLLRIRVGPNAVKKRLPKACDGAPDGRGLKAGPHKRKRAAVGPPFEFRRGGRDLRRTLKPAIDVRGQPDRDQSR
jgi:hypothetical protein